MEALIIVLILGAFCLIVSGCGGGSSNTGPKKPLRPYKFERMIGIGQSCLIYDDYKTVLKTLYDCKANYVRFFGIQIHRPQVENMVHPYKKLGGYNVDIDQWDDSYFKRLKEILDLCLYYGIIAHITLIDECSLEPRPENTWGRHPWNKANGGFSNSGDGRACYDDGCRYWVDGYIKKLCVTALNYPNVIFELGNEITASAGYMYHINEIVKSYGFKTSTSGTRIPEINYYNPHHVACEGAIQSGCINSTDGVHGPDEAELRKVCKSTKPYPHFEYDGGFDNPSDREYITRVYREEL